MKILLFLTAIVMFFGLNYGFSKKDPRVAVLTNYQSVYTGWIDLNEERYKEFEYWRKETWKQFINNENLEAFPKALIESLPDRNIVFSESNVEVTPTNGMIIKFTDVDYYADKGKTNGFFVYKDSLKVTVHFIDGPTGNELYITNLTLFPKNRWGVSSPSFEGRVEACLEKLAQFIADLFDN